MRRIVKRYKSSGLEKVEHKIYHFWPMEKISIGED